MNRKFTFSGWRATWSLDRILRASLLFVFLFPRATQGQLVAELADGDIRIRASSGVAYEACWLLTSTNLAASPWNCVATNYFDRDGNAFFTNHISAGDTARFFQWQCRSEPANLRGWWKTSSFSDLTNDALITGWTNLISGDVLTSAGGIYNAAGPNGAEVDMIAGNVFTNNGFFNRADYSKASIFIVYRPTVFDQTSAYQSPFMSVNTNCIAGYGFALFPEYPGNGMGGMSIAASFKLNLTNYTVYAAGATLPLGTPNLVTIRYGGSNGSNWDIWQNGHLSFKESIHQPFNSTDSGLTGDLNIGGFAGIPLFFYHGGICEIMIFNRSLSDAEVAQVNSDLVSRYQLETKPVIALLGDSEMFGAFDYNGTNMVQRLSALFPACTFYNFASCGATSFNEIAWLNYALPSFANSPQTAVIDMENFNDAGGVGGCYWYAPPITETNILNLVSMCHSNKILFSECTMWSSLGDGNLYNGTPWRVVVNNWKRTNAGAFDGLLDFADDPTIGPLGSAANGAPYFYPDEIYNHLAGPGYDLLVPPFVAGIQGLLAQEQTAAITDGLARNRPLNQVYRPHPTITNARAGTLKGGNTVSSRSDKAADGSQP